MFFLIAKNIRDLLSIRCCLVLHILIIAKAILHSTNKILIELMLMRVLEI